MVYAHSQQYFTFNTQNAPIQLFTAPWKWNSIGLNNKTGFESKSLFCVLKNIQKKLNARFIQFSGLVEPTPLVTRIIDPEWI